MALKVIIDPVVTLNFGAGAVNYDAQISAISFPITVASVDSTNFNSAGWTEAVPGMKSYNLTITFRKDADMSTLDADIWTNALAAAQTATVVWTAQADTDAVATTNPSFTGTAVVNTWTPFAGAVGAGNEESVTWQGTGSITRATA